MEHPVSDVPNSKDFPEVTFDCNTIVAFIGGIERGENVYCCWICKINKKLHC